VGLFDIFLSDESRIQKNQRTLTNRDVQPEDRDSATRWLLDNGSPKALVALLTRFDMSLENQLKDKNEKDALEQRLGTIGEPLVRPLQRHLEKCRMVSIPLHIYRDLKGEEAAVVEAFRLLEIERGKDDFKPQKKLDLLVWLAERKHEKAIEAVSPLLTDFDEGVRYAAAEVIIAQNDEAGRPLLEQVIGSAQEDSNRLRVRLADVFTQRRWPIGDEAAAHLPHGFAAREGRVVAA
jgi:Zn-dependent M32 family carboxypeptidase